jgi:hypothetical protein
MSHRVFLGMVEDEDDVSLVCERREYEMVLGRFADGASSSELGSGAARFFPFGSGTGSLIVRGRFLEGELLRVLQ